MCVRVCVFDRKKNVRVYRAWPRVRSMGHKMVACSFDCVSRVALRIYQVMEKFGRHLHVINLIVKCWVKLSISGFPRLPRKLSLHQSTSLRWLCEVHIGYWNEEKTIRCKKSMLGWAYYTLLELPIFQTLFVYSLRVWSSSYAWYGSVFTEVNRPLSTHVPCTRVG